jgi:8-oxo-dGTP diphosphatase
MKERPAARLLIVDPTSRLLLFKFEHKKGPLAGQSFWATPGGGLEQGETFEAAGRRELREETGMIVADLGAPVATRRASFVLPTGEPVKADERYFLVRVEGLAVSSAGWMPDEREFMTEHRWWSRTDLDASSEQIWPETLVAMLMAAGIWSGA